MAVEEVVKYSKNKNRGGGGKSKTDSAREKWPLEGGSMGRAAQKMVNVRRGGVDPFPYQEEGGNEGVEDLRVVWRCRKVAKGGQKRLPLRLREGRRRISRRNEGGTEKRT